MSSTSIFRKLKRKGMLKMNLHYMVEEAFDKLENAIAHAELHNSTGAADA